MTWRDDIPYWTLIQSWAGSNYLDYTDWPCWWREPVMP